MSSSPPAEFVVPRRLTAVVSVWDAVSLSVVTCKCMRPDPVTVVTVAAAAAKAALRLARVPTDSCQWISKLSGLTKHQDSD